MVKYAYEGNRNRKDVNKDVVGGDRGWCNGAD